MKNIITCLITILFTSNLIAQVAGNKNYERLLKQQQSNRLYPVHTIDLNFPSGTDLFVTVKGLANVKADSYVAIFNITQVGKTAEEVNTLMDNRIKQALEYLKSNTGIEIFVDMLSFVPVYEFTLEKKIFNKKTYNEIPSGFELKKNIHIKYKDPNLLNGIIASLSRAEVYDLVKVDYFSDKLETIKNELMTKSVAFLQEKSKQYQSILMANFDTYEKHMVDGFKVVLPTDMYRSYKAYSNSSLSLKRTANVKHANKANTMYYQPVLDKEFDFVVNPTIVEPTIQVMYEVVLKISKVKKEIPKTNNKEYLMVTPNGDVRNLNIN